MSRLQQVHNRIGVRQLHRIVINYRKCGITLKANVLDMVMVYIMLALFLLVGSTGMSIVCLLDV